MIAQLNGKLVEKNPTEVIIDCNGVGYHVNISLHTYSLLPNSDAIKLFTYLQIKEDSHTLFGFVEKSGSWFSCGDERIGQGRENAKTYLKDNPKMAYEIEDKIRAAHGLDFDDLPPESDAPEDDINSVVES